MTAGTVITPIGGVALGFTIAGTGASFDRDGAFALGTKVSATYNQDWTYVHASAAITRYRWVGFDENFEAAPLTAQMVLDGWQIGVADAVAFADNDFGWVCTKGTTLTGAVAAAAAVDVQLYTSATAGVLDSLALTSVGTSVASMVVGPVIVTAGITSAGANVAVMLAATPFASAGNY